ncbi:hypothetical protein ACJ41O_012172 [Fusarium nematophilum]
MLFQGSSIVRFLAATLAVAGVNAQALPTAEPANTNAHVARATFRDEFTTFSRDTWSCEYTCPVIETGKARFRLQSGIEPDNYGSWSKARYKPQRFTKGKFTVSFSLTERPEQPVWWGVALWDDGPTSDMKNFNEINFGYTTSQSFTNTQLLFESAKRGNAVSLQIDTGVDLYDEQYHTATLEYNSSRVAFYLDGKLLKEVTDKSVIPTDPMDFILGPRLVSGGNPLTKGFTESIDWVEITV